MYREVASLEVLASAGGSVPRVFDHNTQQYEDPTVELYVAMEYIPGQTIRKSVDKKGPFPVPVASQITLKLCETIEVAHTYPILHRDLKPENVILRNADPSDVVIVDYGLSFNSEDPDITITDETFRNRFLDLPETNTPGGNRRDHRSDVTAVCGILYYLLTGHVPGQLQGAEGLPPHLRPGYSLRESLGSIPQVGQLEALFTRGFAPSIDNRFQTIEEFRERLSLGVRDSAGTDVEDPIEIAQRASLTLQQQDRTTQLVELKQRAAVVTNDLHQFVRSYRGKLDRFNLATSYAKLSRVLPSGLDALGNEMRVEISPAHHNEKRIIAYAIAARGEQCVILRNEFIGTGGTPSEWEELVWFDGSVNPDLQPVHEDFKHWLGRSIQELLDAVTGPST